MQDRNKWENILQQIKKKGKRIQTVRKTLTSMASIFIIVIGIWFWQYPTNKTMTLVYEKNINEKEITLLVENEVFYDEIGFIYE